MATHSEVNTLVDEAMELARESQDRKKASEREGPFHLHITDFPIEYEGSDVAMRMADEDTLQSFTEGMIAALEATERPMLISIDVLNRFFMEETLADMKASIKAITEAAISSAKHRVTFSTMRFSPDLERFWCEAGQLNSFIRDYTAEIGEQPINLHKLYLQPHNGQFYTCTLHYREYVEKSALGRNPSQKGVSMNIDWVVRHHKTAYWKPRNPSNKKLEELPLPVPLGLTGSYTDSVTFLNILKSRGLYRGRKARSVSRGNNRRKTSHRTKSRERCDSLVSGARPRGGRSPNSINILERLLNRVSKSGGTADNQQKTRETQKMSEKISTLYQAKCSDLTRMAVELEATKLELDLLRESKKSELDAEISNLRKENEHHRQARYWAEENVSQLEKIKDTLHRDNQVLLSEVEKLRMNKKERRAAKKAERRARKPRYN